ncbi:uncharacterized protein LOC124300235 isoform X1 [Neodiprion virginianus]|uniref:uncharacterized protein LOC124300235 isoform X1 n=1 Tax=Neodiprion virginianus TaxID=2961670 RepID=UPI001EE720AF|nr:uncharacterized protein LOC124300235 isoform X1 [Neodiprion virginianus]
MKSREYLTKFFFILILASHGESLTIDNQLVIIANDCYTRIAIGSILPSKDVAASVEAKTVSECEDECSRQRNLCEIFSYGIGPKGNASCLLGNRIPNGDELIADPDYDVYLRQQSSPSCMPDRVYKLGSGVRNPTIMNGASETPVKTDDDKDTGKKRKNGRRPIGTSVVPGPAGFGTVTIAGKPPDEVPSPFEPNADKMPDDDRNYGNYPIIHQPNFSPDYDQDNPNPNPPYTGYGNKNVGYGGPGNYAGDFYGVEEEFPLPDRHHQDRDYYLHIVEHGNRHEMNGYRPTPAEFSCYRKLFTGKRLAEIHIRKAVNCERIEECGRECDSEKGFPCEGFNYRHPGSRSRHGMCELTAMRPTQIDFGRDVEHEPRYDYYEREQGCRNNANRRPQRPSYGEGGSGWIDVRPGSVSGHEDRRPYLPERGDHRRPIEVPRPLVPHPFLPEPRPHRFHGEPPPWRPEGSDYPPISIRPIEDEVRFDYPRPGRPYLPKEPNRPGPPSYGFRPRPPDLGANEIQPYDKPGRRKDTVHHYYSHGWGGAESYGGAYGYTTNHIDGHEPPKRGNFYGHEKRPFEGAADVYNYGGAFGYGDNYVPGDRDVGYGGTSRRPEHCSVRSGAGFKLRRGIVRKSYLTPSLDHCENLCAIEKDCLCVTFSYRYSVTADAPTDNCLLSEISYRDLDFYTDLEPDRDYDIYSMTGNAKSCAEKGGQISHRPAEEECFWRVRSGFGIPPAALRKSFAVHGLGECEAACVDAVSFTCRSFVYRYGEKPIRDGAPNCFLSDCPTQELDPLSLIDVEGAELYQRGSFGRGCEPYPFPPLNHRWRKPEPNTRPTKPDEVCYAEYDKPCRLTPSAVILTIYVDSEIECRERCSEMRLRGRVPCMAFSYRISVDRDEHNCFMSDVPRRDLRPGIDYIRGDGHLLFVWKEFEPQCDSGYSVGIYLDDDEDQDRYFHHEKLPPPRRPGIGHEPPRPGPSSRPHNSPGHYDPSSGGGGFDFEPRPGRPHGGGRYPPPSGFNDHRNTGRPYGTVPRPNDDDEGYYNRRPLNPDRPDPVGPSYGGQSGGGGYGGGSLYDTEDQYHFSHKYGGSTFQHFTVNGQPCRRGTRCERNKIAGFWSCEPEGGEFGSWDYCCEPQHHCGYSQGYHYPWCYVGPDQEQWRPCSENYYPYLPNPRPGRPTSDRYEEENPYGEVPRPGLLGRHWPVAYLHREAPPNATDSLATADNRRNRELNVSHEDQSSAGSEGIESKDSQLRGNRNVVIVNDGGTETSHTRSGKIERITRFRGSGTSGRNEESSSFSSSIITSSRGGAGNTTGKIQDNEDRELAQILRLRDSYDSDYAVRNDYNDTDSPWVPGSDTTFIKLPIISPNKTREEETFEDYFEIVNVE